jgi:secretory phospholipase A2
LIIFAFLGYGANVLTSLRDAILAAETIFGDFFKNSVAVVKKFKSVSEVFDAAVEENCIFQCPNGES